MKRKYIKPATTVLMVETQNNYCAATSNEIKWVVYDDNDHVSNPASDMGTIKKDKDGEHDYDPWDCGTW